MEKIIFFRNTISHWGVWIDSLRLTASQARQDKTGPDKTTKGNENDNEKNRK